MKLSAEKLRLLRSRYVKTPEKNLQTCIHTTVRLAEERHSAVNDVNQCMPPCMKFRRAPHSHGMMAQYAFLMTLLVLSTCGV